MSHPPSQIEAGLKHLRTVDSVMTEVIDRVGPFRLQLQRNRFRALVRSIIAQQISGSTARSIHQRLQRSLAPKRITPAILARLTPKQMRSAGLSPQKSAYLSDLSQKILSGQVRLKKLARLPDEAVIEELVQVKGIGVWTAQMFLIFSCGRFDVLPTGDLGLRKGVQMAFSLPELPTPKQVEEIGNRWKPYRSVATWYLWKSLQKFNKIG
jgi:DNA-3-methyladenine glycosylase II